MNASKEKCQSTIGKMSVLTELVGTMLPHDDEAKKACYEVMEFLQAAEKRLPTEKAIETDKGRKRVKSK